MKLFRKKPFEENVRKALMSYREEAVAELFPGGVGEAAEIAAALAEICSFRSEFCSVGRCEELLDMYAEVTNATEEGMNREQKTALLRNKYGGTVNRICNYCESIRRTGSCPAVEPEDPVDLLPDTEENGTDESDGPDSDPEWLPEGPEPVGFVSDDTENGKSGLKKLAEELTGAFDLDGRERKKALGILKPERKRAIRSALERFADDAENSVRSVFTAGCTAAGGKMRKTEAEESLPGEILVRTAAAENWTETDEDGKKEILKLAWQMGVRAGVRKKVPLQENDPGRETEDREENE